MKRTRLRRKGKSAPLIKELDRLCRELTFKRDNHRCLKCGKRDRLQWCHVYSRRYRRLRWALLNTMTLCAGCHLWWHHQPAAAILWWRDKIGPVPADKLALKMSAQDAKTDLMGVKLWLEQQINAR